MSEHQLQCAVAQWLDLQGWLWCHPPMGGLRNKAVAAKLKAEGAKAGVPDILIFEPFTVNVGLGSARYYHGIAIELKVGRNKPTESQQTWLDALARRGWSTHVCRTVDEVIEVCRVIG